MVDLTVAPSPTIAQMFRTYKIRPIETISCGVDLEIFKPKKYRQSAQKIFGFVEKTPVILFVGRIAKDKNIDLLIEAIKIIESKMAVQLLLVGPKPVNEDAFDDISIAIKKLQSNVVMTGYLEQ